MAEYYHVAVVPSQRSPEDQHALRDSSYIVRLSSDGSLASSLPTHRRLTPEELVGKLSHYSIAFCKKISQDGRSYLFSPTTPQAFVDNLDMAHFAIEQNNRLGDVSFKRLTFLDQNILAVLTQFLNAEARRRFNLENQFELHDFRKTVEKHGGFDALRDNPVTAVCINASDISPVPERAFVLRGSQKTKDTDIMVDEVLQGYDNTLLIDSQGAHITRLTHKPPATQWNIEATPNAPAPAGVVPEVPEPDAPVAPARVVPEAPEPDAPAAPAVTAEEVAHGLSLKDKVRYALVGFVALVALPILVLLSPFILIAYLAYNKTHGAPNR